MRATAWLLVLVAVAGCRSNAASPSDAPTPGARTAPAPAIVEPIFQGGLQGEWQDHGWANRQPRTSGPERLELARHGGWILTRRGLQGTFGGLVFRLRPAAPTGDFLQVRVDSTQADIFPRVTVGPQHRRELPDGWTEVFISMAELNPELAPFDRVVLRARRALEPPGLVEIDGVGLTAADAALEAQLEARRKAPGLPAAFTVDCEAKARPISPLIYGIAYSALREHDSGHQWKLGATARRWGGNPTSRYNWELGNAWNTASDYYFQNVNYTGRDEVAWQAFLDVNRDRGLSSALTVPLLGWVAKDRKASSFPVKDFGPQQHQDPDGKGAGNGVGRDGKPLTPGNPTRTSVPADADFVGRWVKAISAQQGKRGRLVDLYILDNEPALWHDTHRDVHPEPLTYDELLQRTVEYGTAVREADPDALIAGPAEWGWPGYFFSAADAVAGFRKAPDRKAHDDVPLVEWYLRRLREHEQKTGVRVLDVLDLHFYPQAKGIGVGERGNTDPDTNALRLRSTRGLWDPRYTDESWIKEPVMLLPRMQKWVDENYPGLKLAIGEYSFGAEKHPTGGLALAEALGRFGQHGLWAAYLWTYPPENSPAFWAFRAYRNYDGRGAAFQGWSMPTTAPRDASLFAARSEDGAKVTMVLLNFSPDVTLAASVALKGCGLPTAQRVFTSTGNPRGLEPVESPLGKSYRLPPYGLTVVELTLPPRPSPPDAGAYR